MKQINVLDKTIFLNESNGNFSFYKEDVVENTCLNKEEFIKNFSAKYITICINISNACNLACKYCFNNQKLNRIMNFEYIERKIIQFVNDFDQCERYYIDLSGKGEPLLNLSAIFNISKMCDSLSKKYNKDFVVSFVTNGLLLNRKLIRKLQHKNILFGISLDGPRDIHDLLRSDKHNNTTYDLIMKNVKLIKKREYLGCAVTITKHCFNLLETLLELDTFFETISVKPVRDIQYGFTMESVEEWLREYEKLTKYFVEEIKNHRWNLLKKIINGDDYFGKFIFRCFLNVRVLYRCDAGITRFTIDEDDKIYGCPASIVIPNQNLKYLNTKNQLTKQIEISNLFCANCEYLCYCGGECEIERFLHSGQKMRQCVYLKKDL